MAKKTKKKKTLSKIVTVILLIINIIFMILTFVLNVIPLKYILVILGLFILIDTIIIILLFSKRGYQRLIGTILAIVMILMSFVGSIYEVNTLGFFGSFGGFNYKTLNYKVLVLDSSSYEELEDLKKQSIGFIKEDYINKVIKNLEKRIEFNAKKYNNIADLVESLEESETDALVIEESTYTILSEENSEFTNKVKIIYTFSLDIKTEKIDKSVDVTKDAFNIYISGIDSYGKITSVSRSDVNIVATVNPKTNEIILTSIPRDYYVRLHNTTGYKDKLTHAGIYGIDKSVETIEDLLEIDINYYLKVNFTSLINVVDELDGIKVYSKYSFTSRDGYQYNEGYNSLNGKEALSFVRERKAFKDGDRVRGQNQQAVLEAIINKALSPKIITKYNGILNSLDGKFVTNMDDDDITALIKRQLNNNKSWSFSTINLEGKDGYEYTYSYYANKLYVMIPDENSVEEAKEKIKTVLN